MAVDAKLAKVRNRTIGAAGLAAVAVALVSAVADGGRDLVTALVVVGLVVVAADVVSWRSAVFGVDLAVPEGRALPAPAWGWVVGPAAVVGLLACVIAGSVAGGVIAGAVLIGTLVGPLRAKPAASLPRSATEVARGLRSFVRAHGAAEGDEVPGYLSPLGDPGTRLVVAAPDGAWADALVGADAALVAELARVALAEPVAAEAGRLVRIDRPFWEQMAASW